MNPLSLFGQTSNDIYAVDMSNIATDAVAMGIFVFIGVVVLAVYAIISYLLSRIFRKAGVAAWKAWVPVYNTWVTLELGGQRGWLSLLLAAPLLGNVLALAVPSDIVLTLLSIMTFIASMIATVFLYIAMYKIGQHFGKEDYFVLWAIFLPIVWYAWLAFDQSTWKKSVVDASYTPATPKSDNSHPDTPTV